MSASRLPIYFTYYYKLIIKLEKNPGQTSQVQTNNTLEGV